MPFLRALLGSRTETAYRGAKNDTGPTQPIGEMSPEGLPGLDSGKYLSASQTGEIIVQCLCGIRRLHSIWTCPGCGKHDTR